MKKEQPKRAPNPGKPLYSANDFLRNGAAPSKPEGHERYRTEFRRDYQRLIHSPAFRRLQGKTQLFPSEEHDFYRTRLTHSIEVAQVAKSIATRLNDTDPYFSKSPNTAIDYDLIEFSAVAHDIGHPPFGHNGEYVLDKLMIDHGGFEGNAQTLRILTCLEKKATTEFPATRAFSDKGDLRRGLNPTVRSIAATLKYDRLIPKTKAERIRAKTETEPCKGYYFTEIDTINRVKEIVGGGHKGRFKTIECAIMDVADDIAYSTYDLEDAFAAGFLNPIAILSFDDDAKKDITSRIQRKIDVEFSDLSAPQRNFSIDDMNQTLTRVFSSILQLDNSIFDREWSTETLSTQVGSEVYRASLLLAKSPYHRTQFTSDLIGVFVNGIEVARLGDDPRFWQVRPKLQQFVAIETLKMICYTQLINSDKFLAERQRADHLIDRIFQALKNGGSDLLPMDWRRVYDHYRDDGLQTNRAVCDYISGMTNRFCQETYCRLFGAEPVSIHRP